MAIKKSACGCCGKDTDEPKGICGRCIRYGATKSKPCALNHTARPDYEMFESIAGGFDY